MAVLSAIRTLELPGTNVGSGQGQTFIRTAAYDCSEPEADMSEGAHRVSHLVRSRFANVHCQNAIKVPCQS
jgi:hypothetical protein